MTSHDCTTGLDFKYKDPEPGFKRSSVKGVVANLLRVKDPATVTALEAVAGGKLHQVVVDTERTAKALLSRGQLANRVTLIPLNKVHCSPLQSRNNAANAHGRLHVCAELLQASARVTICATFGITVPVLLLSS